MLQLLNVKLKPQELLVLAVTATLVMAALLGPAVAQPVHQHAFADGRGWANIPNAMDVLSNAAFAAWGVAGLISMHSLLKRGRLNIEYALAALFFTGLICTAAASCWYHLQPDDAGLGVDRLGMTVAFAGLLGLAVSCSISYRAGAAMAGAVLLLAPLSIWFWRSSGDVLPWLVVQFGGMAMIVMVACIKQRPGALAVRWGAVVLIYGAAKLLEVADHDVYSLTHATVSGHSLKHLVASLAAWPVFLATRAAAATTGNSSFARLENPGRIQLLNVDPTDT